MNAGKREKLESQLSAYLDGELTPEEQAEVEAFLQADAGARRLLEELRATVAAVRSLPRARASDDLLDGLRMRMERQALLGVGRPADAAPQTATPFHGRWVAAAAVIALTFVAAYFMWPLTQHEPPAAPARHATDQFVMREESEGKQLAPAGAKSVEDRSKEMEHSDARLARPGGAEGSPVLAEGVVPAPVGVPSPEAAPPREPATITWDVGGENRPVAGERVAPAKGQPPAAAPAAAMASAAEPAAPAEESEIAATPNMGDLNVEGFAAVGFADSLSEGQEEDAVKRGEAFTRLGEKPGDWTVLEFAYADAGARQHAIDALRGQLAPATTTVLCDADSMPRADRGGSPQARQRSVAAYDTIVGGAAASEDLGEAPGASTNGAVSAVKADEVGASIEVPAGDWKYEQARASRLGGRGGGEVGGEDLSQPVTELALKVPDKQSLDRIVAALQPETSSAQVRVVALGRGFEGRHRAEVQWYYADTLDREAGAAKPGTLEAGRQLMANDAETKPASQFGKGLRWFSGESSRLQALRSARQEKAATTDVHWNVHLEACTPAKTGAEAGKEKARDIVSHGYGVQTQPSQSAGLLVVTSAPAGAAGATAENYAWADLGAAGQQFDMPLAGDDALLGLRERASASQPATPLTVSGRSNEKAAALTVAGASFEKAAAHAASRPSTEKAAALTVAGPSSEEVTPLAIAAPSTEKAVPAPLAANVLRLYFCLDPTATQPTITTAPAAETQPAR